MLELIIHKKTTQQEALQYNIDYKFASYISRCLRSGGGVWFMVEPVSLRFVNCKK